MSLERAARILCWLAEECESNLTAVKGRFLPASVEVFDELVVEQAEVDPSGETAWRLG
ncbi:hypothetical protein [Aquamicrobium ahrensii]|uniref:Uncharacterized protein n=1 Tax=Aquamicrobium ahrensii TaxID=469551 RepID=A0ABV2KQR1_9HYPH